MAKKQHILASLRKAEQNIFVPSGLATGVFEELPYDAMQADWGFAETILKATSGLKLGDSVIERRLRDDLIALTALVRVMTAFFEVVSDDIDAYIHN